MSPGCCGESIGMMGIWRMDASSSSSFFRLGMGGRGKPSTYTPTRSGSASSIEVKPSDSSVPDIGSGRISYPLRCIVCGWRRWICSACKKRGCPATWAQQDGNNWRSCESHNLFVKSNAHLLNVSLYFIVLWSYGLMCMEKWCCDDNVVVNLVKRTLKMILNLWSSSIYFDCDTPPPPAPKKLIKTHVRDDAMMGSCDLFVICDTYSFHRSKQPKVQSTLHTVIHLSS